MPLALKTKLFLAFIYISGLGYNLRSQLALALLPEQQRHTLW
uniref:Uncharacterized protein n=1 Tax=Moniliophthora roreri TaxID=221103 RepID=A0A0W0FUZ0_MONRR